MKKEYDLKSVTVRMTDEELDHLEKLSIKLRLTKAQLLRDYLKTQEYKLDPFYTIVDDTKEEHERLKRTELVSFCVKFTESMMAIGITPELILDFKSKMDKMDKIDTILEKLEYLNVSPCNSKKIPQKIIGSQPSGNNLSKFGVNLDYHDPLPEEDEDYEALNSPSDS